RLATNKTCSRARHRVSPRARRHRSDTLRLLGRPVAFAWAKLQPPCSARVLIRRRNRRRARLLLPAELLEARIIPERIEHGIEPEQRWSEGGYTFSEGAFIRCRQKFS